MVPATSWQLIASCIPHSRNVAENLRENRETPQTAPEEKQIHQTSSNHFTVKAIKELVVEMDEIQPGQLTGASRR